MLTGILAADDLVKKAVRPLSLRHLNTSGYGFLCIVRNDMNGSMIKSYDEHSSYKHQYQLTVCLKILSPLVDTVLYTRPMIPNGATLMIHLTH